MRIIRVAATAAGACLAGAAPALVAVAPAAHAVAGQLCDLTEVVTYDPPLTNTPQTVTFDVSGQLVNCTNPAARTGSYHESGSATAATCTGILSAGSGTRVFHWNNSDLQPSTFSYNRVVNRIGGNIQVVAMGSITSGTFTGLPAKSLGVGLQPDPIACATTGASQLTAVGTLTIGL
ncbi:hypothetical protein [Actinomadura terrae]|uniref:hypothetical protein n=1 Tax=Actinomadura terrae TaxID=604353 RepID=UPI001FA7ED50|nr:hypothetical protein [Actinomadura terrae]